MTEPGVPLLFYGNSYRYPDIYQSTGCLAPDPVIALEHGDERIIVASPLEHGRAAEVASAALTRKDRLSRGGPTDK